MSEFKSYEIYTIPASGETKSIDVTLNNIREYNIIATGGGDMTLTGNETISPIGTVSEGMEITFNYNGQITYSSAVISIFGYTLTASEALSRYIIKCNYTNGGWKVRLIFSSGYTTHPPIDGKYIQDNTINGSKIITGSNTLAKLAPASARGKIISSGDAGVYQELDAKTSGYILIGDGTDVLSKPISGDITIDNAGVTTIGTGKVTPLMLSFSLTNYLTAQLTITTAQVLLLHSNPITIIANPGSGKYIEVVCAVVGTTFNTTPYDTHWVLQLMNQGADEAQFESSDGLLTSITKVSKFDSTPYTAPGDTQILSNTPLVVSVKNANPLNGDSDIVINVTYMIKDEII